MVLKAVRRLKLPALMTPSPRASATCCWPWSFSALRPASKLATTRLWHTTTLASELSLQDPTRTLYGAMDWCSESDREETGPAHLAEGDHVLYDLRVSYFEGHTCSLMRFGHSRDGKRGRPIGVYGVMADAADPATRGIRSRCRIKSRSYASGSG